MRLCFSQRPADAALVFVAALLLLPFAGIAGAAFDEAARLDQLPDDQRELAEWFIERNAEMDERNFSWAARINRDAAIERRKFDEEWFIHDVKVARGPVIEKIGRDLSFGKATVPGRGEQELIFLRNYALTVHPATPLLGMLHASVVLEFFADGSAGVGGWIDIMPSADRSGDLDKLAAVTEAHFADWGLEAKPYRQRVCARSAGPDSDLRRQPSCNGVSFYGPPPFPDDTGKSIRFIVEQIDKFTDAYMTQLEQRMDESYSEVDLQAQEVMRRRWLTEQLFFDPFSSDIVSFEVWSFSTLPPMVRF